MAYSSQRNHTGQLDFCNWLAKILKYWYNIQNLLHQGGWWTKEKLFFLYTLHQSVSSRLQILTIPWMIAVSKSSYIVFQLIVFKRVQSYYHILNKISELWFIFLYITASFYFYTLIFYQSILLFTLWLKLYSLSFCVISKTQTEHLHFSTACDNN